MPRPTPDTPTPGQRSVWDFPRPPAIERETRLVRIDFAGVEIAASTRCVRVLETSHPPAYFFPPNDVRADLLTPSPGTSFCEWKGEATYYDLRTDDRLAERVAFAYHEPSHRFREHAGWLSFYAGPMDACWVGDHRATPQPGGFYSGWITPDLAGPFKGVPGSWGW
jgi:uncharacterized protein (DUF427 family)